ncbi:hypothetical protein Ahy_B02g058957 [Arachis hypogaea]|uniref:PB1-like domain-containing protein n=1 Tax=Arachis hypogaea TaxID=3818 RepID=A0A445AFS0_ARAHY|nr:hypothetical protein Ahy_B02g058957 [Arachis hypogaea]
MTEWVTPVFQHVGSFVKYNKGELLYLNGNIKRFPPIILDLVNYFDLKKLFEELSYHEFKKMCWYDPRAPSMEAGLHPIYGGKKIREMCDTKREDREIDELYLFFDHSIMEDVKWLEEDEMNLGQGDDDVSHQAGATEGAPKINGAEGKGESDSNKTEYPWLIYCIWNNARGCYQVKTYNPKHTCARKFGSNMADQNWVAKKLEKRLLTQPHLTYGEAFDHIKIDFNVVCSDRMIYSALRVSRDMYVGNERAQYGKLRDYLIEIDESNPGFAACFEDSPRCNKGKKDIYGHLPKIWSEWSQYKDMQEITKA